MKTIFLILILGISYISQANLYPIFSEDGKIIDLSNKEICLPEGATHISSYNGNGQHTNKVQEIIKEIEKQAQPDYPKNTNIDEEKVREKLSKVVVIDLRNNSITSECLKYLVEQLKKKDYWSYLKKVRLIDLCYNKNLDEKAASTILEIINVGKNNLNKIYEGTKNYPSKIKNRPIINLVGTKLSLKNIEGLLREINNISPADSARSLDISKHLIFLGRNYYKKALTESHYYQPMIATSLLCSNALEIHSSFYGEDNTSPAKEYLMLEDQAEYKEFLSPFIAYQEFTNAPTLEYAMVGATRFLHNDQSLKDQLNRLLDKSNAKKAKKNVKKEIKKPDTIVIEKSPANGSFIH